jgi:hypothetical protein
MGKVNTGIVIPDEIVMSKIYLRSCRVKLGSEGFVILRNKYKTKGSVIL